jgi:hypothetical protein
MRHRLFRRLLFFLLLFGICTGSAHAHRSQKDLPSSQNGDCSTPVNCSGTAYFASTPASLTLSTSSVSGIAAQVSVSIFGAYEPSANYPCSGGSGACTVNGAQTLVQVQLQDSSGNPLPQNGGVYLLGIAVNVSAEYNSSGSPAFFVLEGPFNPLPSVVSSTGLVTETGASDCIDDYFETPCEVFAATIITSVDNGTIAFWPIGSNGTNTAVGITDTTLAIPGIPLNAPQPSFGSYEPGTIQNGLNPTATSSFAILVYDSALNSGAGGVVTLGGLQLSQPPSNARTLTSTPFNLNQVSLPYTEVVDASGGVSPSPISTLDLGASPQPTAPVCNSGSFSGTLNRVVYYSYTPSSAQVATIDTSGSRYDTVILVTDQASGAAVACNDDYTDPSSGNTYAQAKIASLALAADTTYLIQVGEYPDSILYPTDGDNSPPSDLTTNPCGDGATTNPVSCPAINVNPILHFSFSVPAAVSLNPSSITLSNVLIGTSAKSSITVTNTGVDALSISSVTSSNPVFSVSNGCTAPVAAEGTCSIGITFTPAAAGTVSGTLVVTDNASSSPQTMSLTGSGVQPLACPQTLSSAGKCAGPPHTPLLP